ncbi:MAG: arsenate reductase ArsC [Candidatus Scalindua sp.]
MKKKVLFICTYNSARSQMAEGLLNHLCGNKYEAHSAGTESSIVNPYAIQSMAEIGIDISEHRSKGVEEFQGMKFDYVVTVCDNAKETCPFFPRGGDYLHKSFDDPSGVQGNDDVKLIAFRKVRNEIMDWIKETFG